MDINHHIADEFLLSYAAGDLAPSWALAVATHLAMCPQCRARAAQFEMLGAEALLSAPAAPLTRLNAAEVLRQAKAVPDAPKSQDLSAPQIDDTLAKMPEPLRSFVGARAKKWQSLGGGLRQMILDIQDGVSARLLSIPAGRAVPSHGHNGLEMTLVLSGGFYDGDVAFEKGDIEVVDHAAPHQPKAMDGEDCIVLAVTNAPIRFEAFVPRLLQPLFKI